ncbi:MAG: hypothetical protein PHW96_00665 [Candidatus Nanoarchaeia archaeon]|nr:hypothetical protein [Candidatus Nanoarchaeia archaeon]
MNIGDLVKNFEDAKQKIEQILKPNMVLPIFQVEEMDTEHIVGDGFFYAPYNKLLLKFLMSGFDTEATPEELLEAYKIFRSKETTMEEALIHATQRLNEWYKNLTYLKK